MGVCVETGHGLPGQPPLVRSGPRRTQDHTAPRHGVPLRRRAGEGIAAGGSLPPPCDPDAGGGFRTRARGVRRAAWSPVFEVCQVRSSRSGRSSRPTRAKWCRWIASVAVLRTSMKVLPGSLTLQRARWPQVPAAPRERRRSREAGTAGEGSLLQSPVRRLPPSPPVTEEFLEPLPVTWGIPAERLAPGAGLQRMACGDRRGRCGEGWRSLHVPVQPGLQRRLEGLVPEVACGEAGSAAPPGASARPAPRALPDPSGRAWNRLVETPAMSTACQDRARAPVVEEGDGILRHDRTVQ